MIAGFSVIILIFFYGSVLSWMQLNSVQKVNKMIQKQNEEEYQFVELRTALNENVFLIKKYIKQPTDQTLTKKNETNQFIEKRWNSLEETAKTKKEQAILKTIYEYQKEIENVFKKQVLAPEVAGERQKADLQNTIDTLHNNLDKEVRKILKIHYEKTKTLNKEELISTETAKMGEFVFAGVSILVSVIFVFYVTDAISKPLVKITDLSNEVAKGNIKIKEITLGSKDEVGQLSDSINVMVQSLNKIIENLKKTIEKVSISSEQMLISAEQSSNSSNDITNSLQIIASGTEEQMKSSRNSEREIKQMTKNIEKIVDFSINASHFSNQTSEIAEEGNDIINKVIGQMNVIKQSVEESAERNKQLEMQSQAIESLLNIITRVAKKTNFLALNASVQATRAGRHGKGFAIVAAEVKKLAEESSKSARQISDLVTNIQEDIQQSSSSMKDVTKEVKEGMEIANQAGYNFQKILSSIKDVEKIIEEISLATKEISTISIHVENEIVETTAIAKRSVEMTQNVATAAEQQFSNAQEVSKTAERLKNLTENLEDSIEKFTL